MLSPYTLAAQMVERSTYNRVIVGSSPTKSTKYAGLAKSANATDLKSVGRNTLPVQVWYPAPIDKWYHVTYLN